ncbi:MAG: hypothetical protein M1819_006709 [Sarea resinae]|nr:MAG: hypothetical protein M1819_006709 [Sarea resinae]
MPSKAFSLSLILSFLWTTVLASTACNNSPDLCSRSYSNITHLGAHDSAFVRDASTADFIGGDQYYNATRALSAGVRLLSAQVHNSSGEWHLCHTSCALLDVGPLHTWLAGIKTWMDDNPNDVVTILLVNSDSATASDLNGEFVKANISDYGYTPPSSSKALDTWPTLQSLISKNTRLVTFIASLDPSSNTVAPYLLDEFTFVWENPYDVTSLNNFSCVPDRPTSVKGNTAAALSSGRLPLMNHFLYSKEILGIEVPDTGNLSTTNAPSGATGNLGDTATGCADTWGRAPTFILVDFFNVGPAIESVDKLNGITATGRTSVPSTNASPDSDSAEASSSSSASISSASKLSSASVAPPTLFPCLAASLLLIFVSSMR